MNTTEKAWYSTLTAAFAFVLLATLTLLTGCGNVPRVTVNTDTHTDQERLQQQTLSIAWDEFTYTEKVNVCTAFYEDPKGNFDRFFASEFPELTYSTWKDWFSQACGDLTN